MQFLHTNTEHAKTKIKNTKLFTIIQKKIRSLGIQIIKHVKDLYTEKDKILRENKCNQMESHTYCVQGLEVST